MPDGSPIAPPRQTSQWLKLASRRLELREKVLASRRLELSEKVPIPFQGEPPDTESTLFDKPLEPTPENIANARPTVTGGFQ